MFEKLIFNINSIVFGFYQLKILYFDALMNIKSLNQNNPQIKYLYILLFSIENIMSYNNTE